VFVFCGYSSAQLSGLASVEINWLLLHSAPRPPLFCGRICAAAPKFNNIYMGNNLLAGAAHREK